jgi:hypothetical protein
MPTRSHVLSCSPHTYTHQLLRPEAWEAMVGDCGYDYTFAEESLPLDGTARYYCKPCVQAYMEQQQAMWGRARKFDAVYRALSLPDPPNVLPGISHIISRRWCVSGWVVCEHVCGGRRRRTGPTWDSFASVAWLCKASVVSWRWCG